MQAGADVPAFIFCKTLFMPLFQDYMLPKS